MDTVPSRRWGGIVALVLGWAWVAVAAALLLIQVVSMTRSQPDRAVTRRRADTAVPSAGGLSNAAAESFRAFVNSTPGTDVPAVSVDHGYTAEGLRRLSAVLQQRDRDSVAARQLREAADAITRNPRSLEHADIVRDALTVANTELSGARMGVAGGPRRACNVGIDPRRGLLDQVEAVRRFFSCAAGALGDPAAKGA